MTHTHTNTQTVLSSLAAVMSEAVRKNLIYYFINTIEYFLFNSMQGLIPEVRRLQRTQPYRSWPIVRS